LREKREKLLVEGFSEVHQLFPAQQHVHFPPRDAFLLVGTEVTKLKPENYDKSQFTRQILPAQRSTPRK